MIRLGASSWTAEGWERAFYPPKIAKRDYITHYATKFDTVEIDATFYAIPARTTVQGWRDRTPDGFVFAAKVPRIVTHEKLLLNCESELLAFIEVMQCLGHKLGPILFQFPYFRKNQIQLHEFVDRLASVLASIPKEVDVAVEIRNKKWLDSTLLSALRAHNAAITLIDHPYMPRPSEYMQWPHKLITSHFTYIRWLGDRQQIEERIAKTLGEVTFEKSVVDRTAELRRWAELIRVLQQDVRETWAFVNNHFSGFAPDDIHKLRTMLTRDGANL